MGVPTDSRSHCEEQLHHRFVLPTILALMREETRLGILDAGCANGFIAAHLAAQSHRLKGFLCNMYRHLRTGGTIVLTTPYHGYLKNLALALSGKLDDHFTALWDGGHIKFWSRRTLIRLLQEFGFEVREFRGAGRVVWLWKSMVVRAATGPRES